MSDTDSDSSEYTLADSEPDDSELTEPRLTRAGGNLIETGLNVDIYAIRLPGNRVFAVGTNLAGGTRELSAGTDEVMFIGAYRFTGEVTMDRSEPLGDVNSDTYQGAVAEAIAANGNPFEVRVAFPPTYVRDILLSEQARGSAITNRLAGNFIPPQWGYRPAATPGPTGTPGSRAGVDSQSGHGHGNAFAQPAYGPHPGGSSATPVGTDQGQTRRSENGSVDPSQWEYGPTESQSSPAGFETGSDYDNGNAFPNLGMDSIQNDGWEEGDGDDDLYADLGFEYSIPGVPASG
ncbi:hypothetical protein EHS25_005428 [Saitozyma podzolica]|uniref:Uncharacterized protein n=1 Tax=Saitozyma podzolica TaxID=1890683 RepID=A0A427XYC0_9TREE|nr:hypothetical protein EHS25_005428 [Saitozyma podzolica]